MADLSPEGELDSDDLATRYTPWEKRSRLVDAIKSLFRRGDTYEP